MSDLKSVPAIGESKMELADLQMRLAELNNEVGTDLLFSAFVNGICGISIMGGISKESLLDNLSQCWDFHDENIKRRRESGENI